MHGTLCAEMKCEVDAMKEFNYRVEIRSNEDDYVQDVAFFGTDRAAACEFSRSVNSGENDFWSGSDVYAKLIKEEV